MKFNTSMLTRPINLTISAIFQFIYTPEGIFYSIAIEIKCFKFWYKFVYAIWIISDRSIPEVIIQPSTDSLYIFLHTPYQLSFPPFICIFQTQNHYCTFPKRFHFHGQPPHFRNQNSNRIHNFKNISDQNKILSNRKGGNSFDFQNFPKSILWSRSASRRRRLHTMGP